MAVFATTVSFHLLSFQVYSILVNCTNEDEESWGKVWNNTTGTKQ